MTTFFNPVNKSIVLVLITVLLLVSDVYDTLLHYIGRFFFAIFLAHTAGFLYRHLPDLVDQVSLRVPQLAGLGVKILRFRGILGDGDVGLGYDVPPTLGDESLRPTALITGGAMGIGKEMALRCVRLGYHVQIWDVNATAMEETKAALLAEVPRQYKGKVTVTTQRVDVGADAEVRAALVPELRRKVDLLILNAGVVNGQEINDTTDEKVQRLFRVNVFQLFNLTRIFLGDWKQQTSRRQKHIVVIGSIAGYSGAAFLSDYNASKAAANSFAEALAAEIRSFSNISSTLICPYLIDTGMFTGCKPLTMVPFLLPTEVAEHVLNAVKYRRQLVVIPWMFHGLYFLKAILPYFVLSYVDDLLGASTAMRSFSGRKAHAPPATEARPLPTAAEDKDADESKKDV